MVLNTLNQDLYQNKVVVDSMKIVVYNSFGASELGENDILL